MSQVTIAKDCIPDIKKYKDMREQRRKTKEFLETMEMFSFAFEIIFKNGQSKTFATRNYNDLKRWVLGLQVLL